jgi:hypothetical protein
MGAGRPRPAAGSRRDRNQRSLTGAPQLVYRRDSAQAPRRCSGPGDTPRIQLADPVTAYRLAEAGHVNTWWAGDPRQRFWLEITDRPDIGVDLHCPQRDTTGSPTPGYSLIWQVASSDIVFHYSLPERAITAWSRAAGQVSEALRARDLLAR